LGTESTFQRSIDYVHIAGTAAWVILSGGRFSELRPIYQGCRVLIIALARLSCTPRRRLWLGNP